jgi:hypothetical protein
MGAGEQLHIKNEKVIYLKKLTNVSVKKKLTKLTEKQKNFEVLND